MKVTECGSATGVGLFQVTLSPALISTLSGTKIVRGEVLLPPPAATILPLFSFVYAST